MRIKFKAPDPRAGMVAQMDSRRGQDLVGCGAADQVAENEEQAAAVPMDGAGAAAEDPPPPADEQPARRARRAARTATE